MKTISDDEMEKTQGGFFLAGVVFYFIVGLVSGFVIAKWGRIQRRTGGESFTLPVH